VVSFIDTLVKKQALVPLMPILWTFVAHSDFAPTENLVGGEHQLIGHVQCPNIATTIDYYDWIKEEANLDYDLTLPVYCQSAWYKQQQLEKQKQQMQGADGEMATVIDDVRTTRSVAMLTERSMNISKKQTRQFQRVQRDGKRRKFPTGFDEYESGTESAGTESSVSSEASEPKHATHADVKDVVNEFFGLLSDRGSNNERVTSILEKFAELLVYGPNKEGTVYIDGDDRFEPTIPYKVVDGFDTTKWTSDGNTPTIKVEDATKCAVDVQWKSVVPFFFHPDQELEPLLPIHFTSPDLQEDDSECLEEVRQLFCDDQIAHIMQRVRAAKLQEEWSGELTKVADGMSTHTPEECRQNISSCKEFLEKPSVVKQYQDEATEHETKYNELHDKFEAHKHQNATSGYTYNKELHDDILKLRDAMDRFLNTVIGHHDMVVDRTTSIIERHNLPIQDGADFGEMMGIVSEKYPTLMLGANDFDEDNTPLMALDDVESDDDDL
jgi:hypothetical protein